MGHNITGGGVDGRLPFQTETYFRTLNSPSDIRRREGRDKTTIKDRRGTRIFRKINPIRLESISSSLLLSRTPKLHSKSTGIPFY